MTIDIFCHHIPRSVRQLIRKAGFYEAGSSDSNGWQPYPADNADLEVRLQVMDRYGIDMQAVSQTVPVLLGSNAEDAAQICRLSNDANYTLCKSAPNRFLNICILSLLDMRSALRELDRSINELDCRGITVASNQKGKGLDSPEYFPLYEKLVEHDLPLFLQPTNWGSYPLVDLENGLEAMHVIGWPFDTTQAVWRLIGGGVIDRYPSLKIVTHHCGAMIPYFAKRIEKTFSKQLPHPVSEYWDNIYGDTALSGSLAGCQCGYAFFGPSRMMFGSDYPFGGEEDIKNNLASVKAMDIPGEDLKKILSGNAKALLKIV
jgi:aminocarboxymuconate-semialdehyde decarboxylase